MTMNTMLSNEDLQRIADQHRSDLAAMWGRPPVPTSLRVREPGRVRRWLQLRSGRRRAGSVTVTPAC